MRCGVMDMYVYVCPQFNGFHGVACFSIHEHLMCKLTSLDTLVKVCANGALPSLYTYAYIIASFCRY